MVSLSLSSYVKAGDEHNHVNIDQVNSGDNLNLGIEQVGHTNLVKFSFDHDNNTITFYKKEIVTILDGLMHGVQVILGVVI